MWFEEHPAGKRAGDRVNKTRPSKCVLNKTSRLIEWHRDDHFWNVPGSDLIPRTLPTLQLAHTTSVTPHSVEGASGPRRQPGPSPRRASGTTSAALCESRPTFVFRLRNVGWGYPLGTKSSPSNQR